MRKLEATLDVMLPKGILTNVNANVSKDLSATLDAKLVGNGAGGGGGISNKIFLNEYQIYPDIYGNINLNAATQLNLKYGQKTTAELKVDEQGSISLGDIIIDCGGAFDG